MGVAVRGGEQETVREEVRFDIVEEGIDELGCRRTDM